MMRSHALLHTIYRSLITLPVRTVLLLLIIPACGFSQIEELPLKALFLEAAVRFITWPETDRTGEHLPRHAYFTIGTFSNDRLAPHIAKAFRMKTVRSVAARMYTVKRLSDIDSCDLVVVPTDRPRSLLRLYLDYIRGKPILTVSEADVFTDPGVMLTVSIVKQHLSCTINKRIADEANFAISHHLLQKANVIPDGSRP